LPAHEDPADRFLVATALLYDLVLVTADEALIRAKPCPILANR
jgi:PIN domain nuclease of toxin-antitoxin system